MLRALAVMNSELSALEGAVARRAKLGVEKNYGALYTSKAFDLTKFPPM